MFNQKKAQVGSRGLLHDCEIFPKVRLKLYYYPPVTLVPGLQRGYDVPEGGGDVAPAAGPLHIVNRRLGVHLNTD